MARARAPIYRASSCSALVSIAGSKRACADIDNDGCEVACGGRLGSVAGFDFSSLENFFTNSGRAFGSAISVATFSASCITVVALRAAALTTIAAIGPMWRASSALIFLSISLSNTALAGWLGWETAGLERRV